MAVVRTATTADASAIAEAKHQAAEKTYAPLIGADAYEAWAAKRCSPEFQISRIEGPGLTVVADGDKIKAMGFVRAENLGDEDGGVYLGDLYVVEEGAGYGTHLLGALTQQARHLGRYVWTLVFSENTQARAFFEGRGWEMTGSRPNGEVTGGVLCEYRKTFPASYTLIGADGKPYQSPTPGVLGGFRGKEKGFQLYGVLDCSAARYHISQGGYVHSRVFFASEEDAISAGFRPCGRCLRKKYEAWKAAKAEATTAAAQSA